jgi:hypothetical protein
MMSLDEDVWAWAVIGAVCLCCSMAIWVPAITYAW